MHNFWYPKAKDVALVLFSSLKSQKLLIYMIYGIKEGFDVIQKRRPRSKGRQNYICNISTN